MKDVKPFIEKSAWLRKELFELVYEKKKGHIPSCYSCTEVIVSLFYGGYLNLTKENIDGIDRNHIIISKGHAAMVIYPVLVDLGIVDAKEIDLFTRPEGIYRMYADHFVPGIDAVAGSLGHGLGMMSGMALAEKRDGKNNHYYVVLGDGECYEGSVWESALFAAHNNLDNVTVIVDRNELCIMDRTENCVKLDSLEEKFSAFGWDAQSINGHSYNEIFSALDRKTDGRPKAIISQTTKGKGISFMESQPLWHNKMCTEEQAEAARKELSVNCIVD